LAALGASVAFWNARQEAHAVFFSPSASGS